MGRDEKPIGPGDGDSGPGHDRGRLLPQQCRPVLRCPRPVMRGPDQLPKPYLAFPPANPNLEEFPASH